MAKIKTIQCPQCSGINPTKVGEDEYKCTYCDALFHVVGKTPNLKDLINTATRNKATIQQLDPVTLVKARKIVRGVGFVVLVSIVAGVALPIYFATRNIDTSESDGIKPESGWSAPSSESKKYFSGSKDAIMWKMMKESGDRLDSARYTLIILELKTNKRLASVRWTKTMTWRDGFDFSKNYYKSVFAIGDTVWVASEENILEGFDLYSGRKIITTEMLEDAYKEFAPGISEANEVYYSQAIEVKTDDAFTYVFRPSQKLVLEKVKYNDYNQVHKSKKTFFALNDGERPVLWRIRMNVPLFDKESSVSYYLRQNKKTNRNNYMLNSMGLDMMDSVAAGTIFYKGKVMWFNENSAVVMYRESMAKKAAALVVKINADGTVQWKTALDVVKGLSDVFKNDQYVQFVKGEKELIIIHESSKIISAGLDMITGKINWTWVEE